MARRPGQVEIPAKSRADMSAYGFWKRRTTAMFGIIIVNLGAGSYLRMTPESLLQRRKRIISTYTFSLDWSMDGISFLLSTLHTEYPEWRP